MSQFVHLHLHSGFSLLDGAIDHDALAEDGREIRNACSRRDRSWQSFRRDRFLRCSDESRRQAHHRLRDVRLENQSPGSRSRQRQTESPDRSVRKRTGYQNLVKLVSKGYLEGFYYKPRIDKELLREHSEGLIGLSACLNGEVVFQCSAWADSIRRKSAASEYQDIFGKDRFFLEIPRSWARETAQDHSRHAEDLRAHRHPRCRQQRLPLHAEGRLPCPRHPSLHPDRQNRQRSEPHEVLHGSVLFQDTGRRWIGSSERFPLFSIRPWRSPNAAI